MQKSPLFILFSPTCRNFRFVCARWRLHLRQVLTQTLLKADAEEWHDCWSSAQITYRFDHRI